MAHGQTNENLEIKKYYLILKIRMNYWLTLTDV